MKLKDMLLASVIANTLTLVAVEPLYDILTTGVPVTVMVPVRLKAVPLASISLTVMLPVVPKARVCAAAVLMKKGPVTERAYPFRSSDP